MFQKELREARETILNNFESMCLKLREAVDDYREETTLSEVKSWEKNKFYQNRR